uniref:F-box domain-containing protein n=1 Tax=Solanum lycopersicum TaxID=4081 RepID=A0A3Q7EBX0_SOLLC
MEDGNSPVRRWKELHIDMTVKILQSFDLLKLISVIPQVCPVWQRWTCKVSILPYVYVDTPSREKLTRILNIYLNLNRGNILTLIFHYNLYVDNNQLNYTAKRELAYIIEKIGRSCKKISELKIMTPCDLLLVSSLVSLPLYMKVLSVRCTELSKPSLG